ncbi:MAG: Transcriptional regulator ArgP, LysR family [Olavius algarvensis Delta 4 endosymbiont]|nr:MAG: Transcriptional regulator ArgP, LysR family [Olavius algarvensis Delta 4 endosymbiont]
MFDYKLIEAMAVVYNEGGFDKAARTLHLTQSAVSQRVKLLEDLAGQVLLVRSTPPDVTPAGRRMLRHYLKVKKLEDDLLDDFSTDAEKRFASLAIGVNADSLATWFPQAIGSFLVNEKVTLDIRTDDQEQTHRMLKDGEVVGCISSRKQPMQGCRTAYLGKMDYRLFATPAFATKWFPDGFNLEAAAEAPALVFNRKDNLHKELFELALGEMPALLPSHYIPSSEKFAYFISSGLAYGMLPSQQSQQLIDSGQIINLAPGCSVPVALYWHCWNLESRLLRELSCTLTEGAARFLEQ